MPLNNIALGLCDVIYDGKTYSQLASEAVFNAEPEYEVVNGGKLQKFYILKDYHVSVEFSLHEESYETLKLANPSLESFGDGGLYDNPQRKQEGKLLTLHPVSQGNDNHLDVNIFSAIVDPEKSFTRTYDKGVDELEVRFIGQPSKSFNKNEFESFYYIGDVDGVMD